MDFKLPPRKDLAIGGAVVGGALLIYLHSRPKVKAATLSPDTNLNVPRAANSSDAAAPVVGGGGFGYDPGNLTGLGSGPAPETSPIGVVTAPDAGVEPPAPVDTTPAPETSPEPVYTPPPPPAPTVIPTYGLPPGYSPGSVPMFGNPPDIHLLIGSVLGYKQVGGGSNSSGAYNTWRFYSDLGNTADWNFYTSGAKKLQWVGPFTFRYGVGAGG